MCPMTTTTHKKIKVRGHTVDGGIDQLSCDVKTVDGEYSVVYCAYMNVLAGSITYRGGDDCRGRERK